MLLLVFSPDITTNRLPPPTPPSLISISNIIQVFFYGKKQLLLLGQALFYAMFGPSSKQHWGFGPVLALT